MMKFRKNRDCPKCGGEDLSLRYRPAADEKMPENQSWPSGTREEHVEIKCNECSYLFAMAVKRPAVASQEEPQA